MLYRDMLCAQFTVVGGDAYESIISLLHLTGGTGFNEHLLQQP